ncbi:hypothetical protein EDD85DRAFT_446951 [Armillaria nabsnona]|nr:hypothetical protein EDD85DRAFT_446951 [Armillaria nabsnona]
MTSYAYVWILEGITFSSFLVAYDYYSQIAQNDRQHGSSPRARFVGQIKICIIMLHQATIELVRRQRLNPSSVPILEQAYTRTYVPLTSTSDPPSALVICLANIRMPRPGRVSLPPPPSVPSSVLPPSALDHPFPSRTRRPSCFVSTATMESWNGRRGPSGRTRALSGRSGYGRGGVGLRG